MEDVKFKEERENNFTDFRNFGNFLICFRKFDWKSDTRHSFLEFVAKSGYNFIKNLQKKIQKSGQKMKKSEIHLFIREKMLTIFGWNFEIRAVQKYASVLFSKRRINVNRVDLVKSFPTSIYLQKSASMQPRTSLPKFAASRDEAPDSKAVGHRNIDAGDEDDHRAVRCRAVDEAAWSSVQNHQEGGQLWRS